MPDRIVYVERKGGGCSGCIGVFLLVFGLLLLFAGLNGQLHIPDGEPSQPSLKAEQPVDKRGP